MVADDPFYLAKFVSAKSKVPRQAKRFEPELGRIIVAIDMDMRRFIRLVTGRVHFSEPSACVHLHSTSVHSTGGTAVTARA